MNEENLIKYYNKFNEDKRLNSRHGQVEFITSLKYIHEYLEEMEKPKILDIGAGCGRYSIELANEGYDVTAIELVKHNLRVIEQKSDKVKAYQGNALDLSRFKSNSFDLVLLFGPMYHLCNEILKCIDNNMLDDKFHCLSKETDLYSVVRLEDIENLNKMVNLERIKIITPDGPSNYIRPILNKMDDKTFEVFLNYHFKTCERLDLMGAAAHTLDILKKVN